MKPTRIHRPKIKLWGEILKNTVIKANGKSNTPSVEIRNEYDFNHALRCSLLKKIPL